MTQLKKTENLSAMELLRKAYKDDVIEVEFELGGGLIVKLSLADAQEMFDEQKKTYRKVYGEYCDDFKNKNPEESIPQIDVEEWDRYVALFDDAETKKRIEIEKPKNLAEQLADSDTRLTMMKDLLGKYLRNPEGTLHFETAEKQIEFGRFVISTPKLQKLITQKLIELTDKIASLKETAKNV